MNNSTISNNFGYDSEEGSYLEATSGTTAYHHWILGKVAKFIKGNVFEIGAGIGIVTKILAHYTSESILPIEPSNVMYPKLAEKCKQDTSHQILIPIHGTLADAVSQTDLRPDTCIYINVLEHIEDDINEMRIAYEALKPGGCIIAFSPALQLLYSPRDSRVGHYRRYSLKEKITKLKEAGFVIEHAQYMDLIGSIIWYFIFTLPQSDKISQGSVSWYNAIIVKLNLWFEPTWIPFGKNVLVVGRKPAN